MVKGVLTHKSSTISRVENKKKKTKKGIDEEERLAVSGSAFGYVCNIQYCKYADTSVFGNVESMMYIRVMGKSSVNR